MFDIFFHNVIIHEVPNELSGWQIKLNERRQKLEKRRVRSLNHKCTGSAEYTSLRYLESSSGIIETDVVKPSYLWSGFGGEAEGGSSQAQIASEKVKKARNA
ncbi:hypothetical protein Bca4012_007725 [Brassica carinata]|uniref:Uncharacterized protein n=1 Tax=Brassica carinata TaxID=52824 RepID=A0A8X7RRW7_BRACI|nr:hypothetical protein Bca52824_038444 [Brassica carinata]